MVTHLTRRPHPCARSAAVLGRDRPDPLRPGLPARVPADRQQHDAEDLTQEVFVRVFRSLSSYTPGTFEGWLYRITTNLFLDGARRKQRIRFDGLPEDAHDRLPAGPRAEGPAEKLDSDAFDHDVQDALAALPEDFRAAVVLCDIEGMTYDEIADVLDVKLGTVRSRIHRGRSMLRKHLKHRAPRSGLTRVSGPPVDGSSPEVATGDGSAPPGQAGRRRRR